MNQVVQTANTITQESFKQLEEQIKGTNEMVTELRVLLERKDKQLQAVSEREGGGGGVAYILCV